MNMSDDIDALRHSLAELKAERESLIQAHQEELARITEAARTSILENALRTEAIRLGAHDPDAVMALMDRSSIGWSEQGNISGVEQAMAQIREARGYLFHDSRILADQAGRGNVVPKPAPAQIQDARSLTEADYAARKRQFLAGII